ncbi:MAG: HPr family phosphocarrier protein [Planctomycetota bacterium]
MEKSIKIPFKFGVHVRPAVKLAELAQKFRSYIYIEKDGQKANAKSPIEIITLAIMPNSTIKIVAQGEDEKSAIETITKFFNDYVDNI